MITQRPEPYERIENIADKPLTLWSSKLPGGRLDMEAEAVMPVSREAYLDLRGKYDGSIRLTAAVPQVVEEPALEADLDEAAFGIPAELPAGEPANLEDAPVIEDEPDTPKPAKTHKGSKRKEETNEAK